MEPQKNSIHLLFDVLPKPLRNRYFLILLAFSFWMAFFDKHSVITQFSLQGTIDKLNEDAVFYAQKIQETRQAYTDFEKNSEKLAREKYYMSRSDEDVYIIEKD